MSGLAAAQNAEMDGGKVTAAGVGGETGDDSTRRAQRDTMLSPRFYTTDFAKLDRLDELGPRGVGRADRGVSPRRQSRSFRRNDEFDKDLPPIPDALRNSSISWSVR